MRSCTSTDIHAAYLEEKYHFTIEESIKACRNAGFECIDINLHAAAEGKGPLADDDHWEEWTDSLAQFIVSSGAEIPYAHSFFYVYPERTGRLEELTCRSIEAAGRLGVKWVTVHPYSVNNEAWFSRRESMEQNLRSMEKYAAIAGRHGLGIAIENMVEASSGRRFGSSAEDLLELCERLNDPTFGLCWDFGHGERSSCNTPASLRMIGSRLKNVHVHDYTLNKPLYDHTLPFLGNISWNSIMPVMKEIGYRGEWNLECHNFTRLLPPELRPTALRLAYEITENMISSAEGSL